MATKFLYMDEQYIDLRTHRAGGAKRRESVSLTGMLVPPGVHAEFRDRFYRAVATALTVEPSTVPALPDVHAAKLFPDHSDDVRIQFFEDVVSICLDLNFRMFRVGYFLTPEILGAFGDRKAVLGLCFTSLLWNLKAELMENEVWPVMETDNTRDQDRHFAGQVQHIDLASTLIGRHALSIDNRNLGELHYSTKRSAYGAVTDCVSYLLDAKFIVANGISASPFKCELSRIAQTLDPQIEIDEIVEMNFSAVGKT